MLCFKVSAVTARRILGILAALACLQKEHNLARSAVLRRLWSEPRLQHDVLVGAGQCSECVLLSCLPPLYSSTTALKEGSEDSVEGALSRVKHSAS